MYVHSPKIHYYFSVNQLIFQKNVFKHKICYKNKLAFLRLKQTPTNAITTRLMKRGLFLKLYKTFLSFYMKVLLPHIKTLNIKNELKNLYIRYFSFNDFNRILF